MKWKKISIEQTFVFRFSVGTWPTPFGKARLSVSFAGEIFASIPDHGYYQLDHDEMYRGLAELIPELREQENEQN